MIRSCSVPNCHAKHLARGYCQRHYRQFKRTGSPHSEIRIVCSVAECKRAHYARGHCKSHYELERVKTPL